LTRRRLHIVICNERLLPRFGVDRLLLLLGNGLRDRDHRITFICLRCDLDVVSRVSPAIHVLTELGLLDLHGAEQGAASWLRAHWAQLSSDGGPDLVVCGGWPFFGVAQVCAEFDVPSLFIDAGAVPHDGMSEGTVQIQYELRRIRGLTLPCFTQVLPISDFIRDSQTVPERGTSEGVETVLLGADHLDIRMFPETTGGNADRRALALIDELLAAGCKPIISLGRFEPQGYKNSPTVFEVLAGILRQEPKARLLLLASEAELSPPGAVRHAVLPLGFVSDGVLDAVMARCALGLSLSLWEGFNLPLAEMQWRERPVLAFSLGAHPEVTVDPWMLCGSVAEMVDKTVSLLRDGLPPHVVAENRFGLFRTRFRWSDVIARYAAFIERLAGRQEIGPPADPAQLARIVLVDCSCAAIDPANPGVIRVVRRTCHALQEDPQLLLVFVRWDPWLGGYRFLTAEEQHFLASYDGPTDGFSRLFSTAAQGSDWPVENVIALLPGSTPPMLFLPEVVLDGQFPERLAWAAANDLLVAAILYDLIPVTHMPFCASEVVQQFSEYLEALACVDGLWAISGESLREFERYADRRGLPLPPERDAIWLPGQFAAEPRNTAGRKPVSTENPLRILCVGSVEPRKNHRNLIEAFRSLLHRRPDLPLRLVLVGHRFADADHLADWLEAEIREEPRIQWTGLLPDAELGAMYRDATFTVYPSLVEGFGLPVMESLWMGCPCLCHSGGVMAELAMGGGCLTADMDDTAAIERALERLVDDAELRHRLSREAAIREISDWRAYATKIANHLKRISNKRIESA
jgi:glycosyltransferase involved in cell wall biosynthesis